TYHAASRQEIAQIYQQSVERMNQLRDRLAAAGMPALRVSVGDTPGCSVVEKFGEVDEIRPGNFVFYDAMQMQLGACREEDIALAVACPVVAIHPERQQLVIYGGAVHLSKDYLEMPTGENFGLVAPLQDSGWGRAVPETFVTSLSQEHGVIQTNAAFLQRIRAGDLLAVIPIHSCLTANLLKQYMTLDGEIFPMGIF
ncbi:MAG: hypothetical protein D6814_18350, partial [Calditrichaeota bacterium]